MELNKLINLAKRLEPIIRINDEEVTAQIVYDVFTNGLYIKQKEFFYKLSATDIIDLVILIYCIKKTGNVNESAQIFENMFFSCLLVTENEGSEVECNNCDGNGNLECDECDGRGTVKCETCEGEGTIPCEDCDGTGSETCENCDGEGTLEDGEDCPSCNGKGGFTCGNCEGSTEVECDECDGDGYAGCNYCSNGNQECQECYGSGTVTSDTKIDFQTFEIVCWSKEFNDSCEIYVNTKKPVTSESDFMSMDEKIIFHKEVFQMEPEMELESDEFYCYIHEKESGLYRTSGGKIRLDVGEEYEVYFI